MKALLRAATGLIVLGALLTGSPPAQADDEPYWVYLDGARYTKVAWRLDGRIEGRPGSTHTGRVTFASDGHGFRATLNDWRCPRGVTAPLRRTAETACSLKAWISVRQTEVEEGYDFLPDLSWSRIHLPVAVRDSLAEAPREERVGIFLRGLRPVTRHRERWTVEEDGVATRHLRIDLKRPARPQGYLSWLRLGNPDLEVVSATVRSWDEWVKVVPES
jgi:hypothetical protein